MPINTLLLLLALALFSKAALPVALAQPIAVSMSPAKPLQFCGPGSRTLTATATNPGFASGTGFNDNVYAVLRQADGQLLLGGSLSSYGSTARTPLAHLLPDGTLDTGFVPSGIPAGAEQLHAAELSAGKAATGRHVGECPGPGSAPPGAVWAAD